MNLKEAKDSSILGLMHASTGFRSEVLSMARRVINFIRSCAFANLLTIAVLVHGSASAELRSGTLELDPAKTLIEFRLPGAFHTTHGTFKLERGTIIGDPATGKAGGSIVVDARSGDTGIGARDNDMRESVLEAQRYPEITFDPQHFTLEMRGEGQLQATMQGVLTLHGGRHDVALTAQGQLVGDNLTATAHFSVPYVDWGLKDPSVLFLTVAKQVDIDIATSGHVVWNREAARNNERFAPTRYSPSHAKVLLYGEVVQSRTGTEIRFPHARARSGILKELF